MLDEIFPVQFIEGVNENAEPVAERCLEIRDYDRVAIQYAPKLTFLLNKMEMCLKWKRVNVQESYNVNLRSDYNDNPTDIVLSDGELVFSPTDSGYGWCKIDLKQPVVVISKEHYWIDLESRDALFKLLRVKDGDGVAMRAMVNNVWSPGSNELEYFMLRLYGRVLPVVS